MIAFTSLCGHPSRLSERWVVIADIGSQIRLRADEALVWQLAKCSKPKTMTIPVRMFERMHA